MESLIELLGRRHLPAVASSRRLSGVKVESDEEESVHMVPKHRVPPTETPLGLPWVTALVSFGWVCATLFGTTQLRELPSDMAFCSFRATALLLLWLWSLGLIELVLTGTKINHYELLGLPGERNVENSITIFKAVQFFCGGWILCALFYFTLYEFRDMIYFMIDPVPLVLLHILLFTVASPFEILGLQYRRVFLGTLWETVIAPLARVDFRHVLVGDHMTSLVRISFDYLRALCTLLFVYSLGPKSLEKIVWPLVALFPAWCRLQQCVRRFLDSGDAHPNMTNAAKYSMSAVVMICVSMKMAVQGTPQAHTYREYWMIAIIISTIFNYGWDIVMDWGLTDENPKRHPLMFREKWMYHAAAAVNLVLRATWAIEFLKLAEHGELRRDTLDTLLACLEISRRCLWTILRVEQEYFAKVVYSPSMKLVQV